MPSNGKEIRQLLKQVRSREARKAGWKVTETSCDHHVVWCNGKRVATLPGTGGGGRGLRNARAELKRAGFPFDR